MRIAAGRSRAREGQRTFRQAQRQRGLGEEHRTGAGQQDIDIG
jgi:hypothetical protein